jgi:hypothetical protein
MLLASLLDATDKSLKKVGGEAGLTTAGDLPTLIGRLIAVVLGAVGILFVILVVQSGIQYMTAGGDDTKVKTAKTRIIQAVIGIVITVGAYAISSFVINQISKATEAPPSISSTVVEPGPEIVGKNEIPPPLD